MQNFAEMLSQSLVNPIKERLNGLKTANQANAEAIDKLSKQLTETNERQAEIGKKLDEVDKALQTLTSRVDQLVRQFIECKETQAMLISALEGLKWNDQEESTVDQPTP
ncbi:MAG: hypothetical protein IJS08_07095 [Victivallales bacterium]|nr:hypothetical protein [Victivallales bacterium]